MAILKVFLMIFTISPILFAQTGSSRECDTTLKLILGLHGQGRLPPRSLVVEVDSVLQGIQRAELALKEKKRALGPGPRVLKTGTKTSEERQEYVKSWQEHESELAPYVGV